MKSLFFEVRVLAEQDCVKKSFEDEGIVIALLEIVNDGDTVSSCTYQISSANLRELNLANDCHIASPWLYFMHDKKTQEISTLTVASANDSTTNNNKYLEISNLPLSARLCVTKYVNGHEVIKVVKNGKWYSYGRNDNVIVFL